MLQIKRFIDAHKTVFTTEYPCHNEPGSADVSEKMKRLTALIPDSFKVTVEGKPVHFLPAKINCIYSSKHPADGSVIVSVPEKWVTHMKHTHELSKEWQVFNEFLEKLPHSREKIREILDKLKADDEKVYKTINGLIHNNLCHHVMSDDELASLVCANSIPVEKLSESRQQLHLLISAVSGMMSWIGIGALAHRLYYRDYHPETNPHVAGYISSDTYLSIESYSFYATISLAVIATVALNIFYTSRKVRTHLETVADKVSQLPETVKTLERRRKIEILADSFNRQLEKINNAKLSPITRMGQKMKQSFYNFFASPSLNSRIVTHLVAKKASTHRTS